MTVSIIIPTKNGGRYLEQLLLSIKEQSIKPIQILIIDSLSEDDTLKICKAFEADIIQIDAKTFDHGGTRNLAASKAHGEILVYLTQDVLLKDSRCLENLIVPLEEKKVAASYARQIPCNDANPIERFARSFNYPAISIIKEMAVLPTLGIKTFFFSNACSAIKKKIFEEVEGFPDKTIMNEDMFLAAKLIQNGYKIAYQAEAVVCHSHNYSLLTQFKRYFDIGVFFSRNRWITDLARSEKEGVKYVTELLGFLFANKKWAWIPYALVETMTRFLGFRTGLFEKGIPVWLKKRMSNNAGFWKGGG